MDVLQTSDTSHHGIVENSPYRIPYDRHAEGGQLGASWYFSRKEIEENSLSRRDGIDLKKEAYLRKSYCTFLQDLGMRLKVPQATIATAIVFCHRFFLRQSHAKNDRRTIATVCMFLAGKVEETPRPLKDVILLSYEIIYKKDPAAVYKIKQKEVYEQQKELILLGERVVLVTLGFDLNVHHPYKPLVEAIKKFKVAEEEAEDEEQDQEEADQEDDEDYVPSQPALRLPQGSPYGSSPPTSGSRKRASSTHSTAASPSKRGHRSPMVAAFNEIGDKQDKHHKAKLDFLREQNQEQMAFMRETAHLLMEMERKKIEMRAELERAREERHAQKDADQLVTLNRMREIAIADGWDTGSLEYLALSYMYYEEGPRTMWLGCTTPEARLNFIRGYMKLNNYM